jgi:hypothetical protein
LRNSYLNALTVIIAVVIISGANALFSTNVSWATNATGDSNFLIYSNFNYGIKIKYPSAWTYYENKSNINYLFNEGSYDKVQNIVTFAPLNASIRHLPLPVSVRSQLGSFHFLRLIEPDEGYPVNPLVEYPLSTTFVLPSVRIQIISVHNSSLLLLAHQFLGNLSYNIAGYSPAADCSIDVESFYHIQHIPCSFPLKNYRGQFNQYYR